MDRSRGEVTECVPCATLHCLYKQRHGRGWRQRRQFAVSRQLAVYCVRKIQRCYRAWKQYLYDTAVKKVRLRVCAHSKGTLPARIALCCSSCSRAFVSCRAIPCHVRVIDVCVQDAVAVIESFWIARKSVQCL